MKRLALLLALLPCIAATTPADAPLPEDQITTVEVDYAGGPVRAGNAVQPTEPGTYHYKVYVPKGYAAGRDRTYQTLFVFSPGGDAGMTSAEDRLKREGWIVVMLVESKNGPWEPIAANFVAAHDDVTKRLRVAEGMKFAVGFSGGARAASVRPGFAGVICQGAGFWSVTPTSPYDMNAYRLNPRLCVAIMFGDADGNKMEIPFLSSTMPPSSPFRVSFFKGGHDWAPADQMNDALDWMENLIYFQAPPSPALKPFYLRKAGQLLTAADAAEEFAKFDALDKAVDLITKQRLTNEPSIKEKLPDARKQLATLRRDPELKDLIRGREIFERVSAGEDMARVRGAKNQVSLTSGLMEVGRAYAAIAKQYPDTAFGKAAQARVDSLEFSMKGLRH